MKKIILTLIIISSLVYPQSELLKEQIEKLESLGVSITEIQKNEFRFEYPNGKVIFKNCNERGDISIENSIYDSLIIDLSTININQYQHLYRVWRTIPITSERKLVICDSDKNGKMEIYSTYARPLPIYEPEVRVYEYNNDSTFSFIWEYEDTLTDIRDVGDIDNDGLLEIVGRNKTNKMIGFKQDSLNKKILKKHFVYSPFGQHFQPNDNVFYDINNDGMLEMIYYLAAGGDSVWSYSNHIAKFDTAIQNFNLCFYHRISYISPSASYTNGISTGDFDNNGKGNFATGSFYGKFLVFEHVQADSYRVQYQENLATYNAYFTTFSPDLDGNGKPEIWIGGDFLTQTSGITRLYVFEPDGNGAYNKVFRIDILGLFELEGSNMQTIDVDNDGQKEVMLQNGRLMFFFKNDGINRYKLDFFLKNPIIDSSYNLAAINGTYISDLDYDTIPEIFTQNYVYYPLSGPEFLTFILKRNKLMDVDEELFNNNFEYILNPNFPNPFNSETKISFEIPKQSNVRIKVYNTIGKEIITLLNDELTEGKYTVSWNGEDARGQTLNTGVYFIRVTSGNYIQTVKAILLK